MRFLVALSMAMAVTIAFGAANADPVPRPRAPAIVSVEPEHVQLHASMSEQMRVMAADGRMIADPMWSEMMTDTYIRAEERHRAGMDRMLARSTP